MEAFIIQFLKFCFKTASLEMSILKRVCSLGFMWDFRNSRKGSKIGLVRVFCLKESLLFIVEMYI